MKKFTMFLLALGLLSGCWHDDKKNNAANDLVGTWRSICKLSGDVLYDKIEYKIEESVFTKTRRAYSDSNCTTEVSSSAYSVAYITGNSVTTSTGNRATELDIKFSPAITHLDLYAIIDSKLYFGDDTDNNPATRPMVLDFNSYFVRL